MRKEYTQPEMSVVEFEVTDVTNDNNILSYEDEL